MPTTAKGYRYPDGSVGAAADLDLFIQQLAEDVDASPGIRAYTQAQIDALPADQKWAGRIVWNVTAGVHQKWDGATWGTVSPDLSAYARKDQAQTFVGNQEIEGALDINDGASAGGSLTGWTDANGIPKLIQNGAFRASHATQPYFELYKIGVSLVQLYTHNGSPEGVITAAPGCLCLTATGFLYVKRSGTGNTGWRIADTGYLSEGTATDVATVDIALPTWGMYEITCDNFDPANNNPYLMAQLSFDGGVTWQTDAMYEYAYHLVQSNSLTQTVENGQGTAHWKLTGAQTTRGGHGGSGTLLLTLDYGAEPMIRSIFQTTPELTPYGNIVYKTDVAGRYNGVNPTNSAGLMLRLLASSGLTRLRYQVRRVRG